MSILLETEEGWIISHEKYFDKVQVKSAPTLPDCEDISSEAYLKLNPDLFEITEPFKDKLVINGKRVKDDSKLDFSDITLLVKGLYERMRSHPESKDIFEQSQKFVEEESHKLEESESPPRRPSSNAKAVQTARNFFDTVKDIIQWPEFHGQNPSSGDAVKRSMDGCDSSHKFIFLPNTKFYCKDVSDLERTFCGREEEERFDVIVMDPPWRNKFIRRKKRKQHEAGYQLIDDDGIAKLPIGKLLKDDGLVVCWCTNAKSHQDALINEIFRDWNVKYLETWYWLKVTKSGVPICHFNIDNRKQPYEVIIIGTRQENLTSSYVAPEYPPKPKIVVSVPSSINSHKPPLIDILRRRFRNRSFEHKCEIFARYLIPGFTSFGNEVIKLQHSSLFVER